MSGDVDVKRAGGIDLKTILEIIRIAPDVGDLPDVEDFNDFLRWCRALGKMLQILSRFTKTDIDDRVVFILVERVNDEGVMRVIHSIVVDFLNSGQSAKSSASGVYQLWDTKSIEPSVIFLVVELVIKIIELLRNK